ncbi:MAG: septum formation initiator family protein [Ignavibacteria bacterium]|nr:septum formation initiator family protein [Ignavibacteria bacterium]
MAVNKKNIFFFIYITGIIIFIVYLTFNDYGFIKYFGLKSEIQSIQNEIKFSEEQNERLKMEIDSLQQKVRYKIERIAREKYGMSLPNEIVIKVEVK